MLVLKPSAIAGIGVFTTAPIVAGAHLRLWRADDWRFLTFEEAERDPEVRALKDVRCVRDDGGYWCPLDFHAMSIGWYMNHSNCPNVHSSKALNYEYYALHDIAADQEIVCDYSRITPYESAPTGADTPLSQAQGATSPARGGG